MEVLAVMNPYQVRWNFLMLQGLVFYFQLILE